MSEGKLPKLFTAKIEGTNKKGDALLCVFNEDEEIVVRCSSSEAYDLVSLLPILVCDIIRVEGTKLPDEETRFMLNKLNDTLLKTSLKLVLMQSGAQFNDVVRIDWEELDRIKEDK